MFTQAWQVGLDIQSDCIRALAVQRRRNGGNCVTGGNKGYRNRCCEKVVSNTLSC
ncbi:Uncharacterised protein [Serratia liquefaciens]|nr:Uncharacterised protein [Serratia liquefaciens]